METWKTVSSLGWPCLPAVSIYGTVNRGSEFTHMRVGPVGYHNKMRQLESTCDRRLMAVLTSTPHCFTWINVSIEPKTFYIVFSPEPGWRFWLSCVLLVRRLTSISGRLVSSSCMTVHYVATSSLRLRQRSVCWFGLWYYVLFQSLR